MRSTQMNSFGGGAAGLDQSWHLVSSQKGKTKYREQDRYSHDGLMTWTHYLPNLTIAPLRERLSYGWSENNWFCICIAIFLTLNVIRNIFTSFFFVSDAAQWWELLYLYYYYYVMCVMVRTGFNNLKYVKLIVENTFMITSNHFIIRLRIQLEWPRMSLCLRIIM